MNDCQIFTSTVADGNMSFAWGEKSVVLNSRKKFLTAHMVPVDAVAVMHVEHGNKIVHVKPETARGTDNEGILCDALIANDPASVLFLLTADCFPCVLFDPISKTRALLHLGWKPTHLRLPEKVARNFSETLHIPLDRVLVWFGPGILPQSYVTQNPSQQSDERWKQFLHPIGGGVSVDVQGYACKQLIDIGVRSENISRNTIDTNKDVRYFSHTRDRASGNEGRFATVVQLL